LKVVSVASGKGGVGKSVLTVNLALAAKRMGYSVLILDGDLGMANVDVLLGLSAKHNISDVLEGKVSLKNILIEGPLGMKIIPSGSGVSKLTSLSYVERLQIMEEIEGLDETFDIVIIDTGAGIAENVTHLNAIADDIVVVTNSEPHAMTDAYAFIKVMHENYDKKRFNLVVNMTKYQEESHRVHNTISEVAKKFLGVKIDLLGNIPFDVAIKRSVMARCAASDASTYTIAGQEWNEIARRLFQNLSRDKTQSDRQFWRDFLKTRATGNLQTYAVG
jgi:flagellar biosynthesis protein FlhG